MDISMKSWHVLLYRWVYLLDEDELPDNICVYFWKFIFALLVAPIYAIWDLPMFVRWVYVYNCTNVVESYMEFYGHESGTIRFVLGFLYWVIVMLAVAVVSVIIAVYIHLGFFYASLVLVSLGIVVWVFYGVVINGWLRVSITKRRKREEAKELKRIGGHTTFFSMCGKAISGWYNKHCTQINWK